MAPEIRTMKDKKEKVKVLGLAVAYSDIINKAISFSKVLNVDADGRVPIASTYNSSTNTIGFQVDFTEREYIYQYFSYLDIIQQLGGINAFFMELINLLAPISILLFLIKLSKIIIFNYKMIYRNELLEFINRAHKNLIITSTEKDNEIEQIFSMFEPNKDIM